MRPNVVRRAWLLACVVVVAPLFDAPAASAALVASDTASSPTYAGGSAFAGLNGGVGFQPWAVTTAASTGSYLGTDRFGVNINTPGNKVFGLWSDSTAGASSTATRAFTANAGVGAGPLDVGQGVAFDLDVRNLPVAGRSVSAALQTAAGVTRVGLSIVGGVTGIQVTDASGTATFPGSTDAHAAGGFRAAFTLTGADAYALSLYAPHTAGAAIGTVTGTLAGPAGAGVSQVRFANNGAGASDAASVGARDYYFNTLQVVPEPGAATTAGLAAASLALLRRRRPGTGAKFH